MKGILYKSSTTIFFAFVFCTIALSESPEKNDTLQKYGEMIRRVQEEINQKMKRNKIQGVSLALVDDGNPVWVENFGFEDEHKEIPVTSETGYLLGSITKVFTAIGVMQMVERGQLGLDDPLQLRLPQFNMKTHFGSIKDVTIRNVMSHHGGIPCDVFEEIFMEDPDLTKTVDYLNKEYAVYPPGFIRSYSNAGYTLLGHMIQVVSGNAYPDYINTQILLPAGMYATGFFTTPKPFLRISQAFDKKGRLIQENPPRDVPAGGMYSTLNDMIRFISALQKETNEIIHSDRMWEMASPQNKGIPLDLGKAYGLCWSLKLCDEDTIVYHSGATKGHRAVLALNQQTKLGIVILTNSENGGEICSMFPEILEEACQLKKGGELASVKRDTELSGIDVSYTYQSQEILKDTGYYAAPGICIHIQPKRKYLVTTVSGIKIKLKPLTEGGYMPQATILGIIRKRMKQTRFVFEDISNHRLLIQVDNRTGTRSILGVQFKPRKVPETWEQRLGVYTLGTDLGPGGEGLLAKPSLELHRGILYFCITVNPGNQRFQFPLGIINDHEARMLGLGRFGGGVLQSLEEDGKNHLFVYGLHMVK